MSPAFLSSGRPALFSRTPSEPSPLSTPSQDVETGRGPSCLRVVVSTSDSRPDPGRGLSPRLRGGWEDPRTIRVRTSADTCPREQFRTRRPLCSLLPLSWVSRTPFGAETHVGLCSDRDSPEVSVQRASGKAPEGRTVHRRGSLFYRGVTV